MPVLVPETLVTGRRFVAAELRPHGVIDQLGPIVRDLDIRANSKEYILSLAGMMACGPSSEEISLRATLSRTG